MEVKLQSLCNPLAKEACDSMVQVGQTCPFRNSIVSIVRAPVYLLDLPVYHFIGAPAIFPHCVQEADVLCRCVVLAHSRADFRQMFD